MSFVVMENYIYKEKYAQKLKDALLTFLPLLDKIDSITAVELFEDRENFKIVAITKWYSKDLFNEFLLSPFMKQMLGSQQMDIIKESILSFDVQMYDSVEIKNVKP